ncbi:MAG: MBL fold metallo-hydrolase [Pseudomonadota bacterium]|nr:MBL fold metallo-hydrolase [Pseudomonadota bacterium]
MTLKISRILHAGYIFEHDKTQIAFDPIFENPFSKNCHAFPNVRFDHEKIKKLKFAAIFISHFHDDHCSLESLNFLDRNTPIYIFCLFEELFFLIRELGFKNVQQLEIDAPITICSIEITPRKALDSDVDSMFQIKAGGLNVLNVVDSWIDSSTLKELGRIAPWDMVLWPFQTMREIEVLTPSRANKAAVQLPSEWIEQLKILNPRYIVPSSCQFVQESWSWYNQALFPISYRQFKQEVESALPSSRVVRLNPSVAVELNKTSLEMSSSLTWIQPVGEQDLDYQYNGNVNPPATAEISRQFAPLTLEQTESVYDYCRSGLLEKYNSMEPPVDSYFKKPRLWQLSLYDHKGEVRIFRYVLNSDGIKRAPQDDASISWSTEVPISKLYAALNLGESLTSMYMRINDRIFDSDIEKEIGSADVVEDPLIRCLFNGAFGAYQTAQLKRLKSVCISLS